MAEEQVEMAAEELVYIDAEGEEVAAEAEEAFFEDVSGDAVDYDGAIAAEGEEVVVAEEATEEVVYEEAVAEEGEVVYEEVVQEGEVAEEEAAFVEDTEGDAVPEAEVAVEGEVAETAVEAEEGGAEDFCIDTSGDGAEEVPAEEVAVEAPAEEVAVEAPAEEVAVEAPAEEVVEEAPAQEDDGFVMDTAGDEAPAAEEEGGGQAPAADEEGGGQLFGDAVADSFSIDIEGDAEMTPAAEASDEPAVKKQKLEDGSCSVTKDIDSLLETLEAPDSPIAEGLPDNLDELDSIPFPVMSPTFKAPSAKWSGAPKRPPSVATPSAANRAIPKASVRPMGGLVRPPFKAEGPRPPSSTPPPGAATGATGSTKHSSTLDPNSGYVFICNNQTMWEVASKRLFGSPDREFSQMKAHIKMDTRLFLLNLESLKMIGPFAPNSLPAMYIDRSAFRGRFNAQVRAVPTEALIEAQLERKIPAGPKDEGGMRLIQTFLDKGGPAPITVTKAWNVGGASSAPTPAPVAPGQPRPTHLRSPMNNGPRPAMPGISPQLIRQNSQTHLLTRQGSQPHLARQGSFGGPGARPITPKAGGGAPMQNNGGAIARTDKYVPGCDKEGRQYDLQTVVVNFCNVGASYASKVLLKDNKKGDRLFDWEGVRKCVKCLTQELGLQVVGCIMENYWGPDNGSSQRPIPDDIRAMCNSIQETPSLTGKNHKSADDEMTIKCAWRRNCRFMDNDNYRDWLREMRDNRVRKWLDNCQEMLQMRYFFDTDLGTFDTLDGNVPVGLLAENSKAKAMMNF